MQKANLEQNFYDKKFGRDFFQINLVTRNCASLI